jgi:formate hydrogenlyase subunit 3/multisubunit Na+/H+ antiporter MnhD subunit
MLIATAALSLLVLAFAGMVAGRFPLAHRLVYAGTMVAALLLTGGALSQLTAGPTGAVPTTVLPIGLPWLQAHFRLDALSAFFMALVDGIAAIASLFAIGYGTHVPEHRRVTPLFPLFLFGMNLVLLADDAFSFLVAWEFMSLSSWLLVLSDHRSEANREAARIYLIMAVGGTFCLLAMFGLLSGNGGDYAFATMRHTELLGLPGHLVVLLVLLGAGSKAGLVPLHAWLPLAHPAAPSHVSALMSGVMTKVALYAIIRVLFDLNTGVAWWWGAVMMVVGGLTAVIGVLYAMMQTDLKRLLAYSTVENVGIIIIAVGLALAFDNQGDKLSAALALVAALYHALNHSFFKCLLFLGSGSVLAATHERDLNKLGGLLKRMPITGTTFLLGAAAISALPPLNGFVSEWMLLQALFRGPALPHWTMKFGIPIVGALMALAAALAAACFVRAYGIAFLGRARSAAAAHAGEANWPMRIALIVLAVGCVVLGVIPVTVSSAIAFVVNPLIDVQLNPAAGLGWPWLSPIGPVKGSYSATVVILAGGLLLMTGRLLVRWWGVRALRRGPAWDCGHNENIPDAQYTADSFAQPLRRVFGTTMFAAREEVEMPMPGDMEPARHRVIMRDTVWDLLYQPIGNGISRIADLVNKLQFQTVRRYLLLMFLTLVFLLVLVAVRR